MEQWHQECREIKRGPPFQRAPPTPPLPPPHLLTHIVPSAPMRSGYMSYIWLCFGMLKTTDDPPFPIYVLFLLFNLCQSATKKARQGGGWRKGPSSGSHMALSGTPRGPFRGPPPTPAHAAQAISLLPLFHLHYMVSNSVLYQIVRFS